MVMPLKRRDRAIAIDPEKIFADNHEAEEMTAEGIMEGYANIMRRPEMERLENLLLAPGGVNDREG